MSVEPIRAHLLTKEDPNSQMLEFKGFINKSKIDILIDSGASRNFIDENFVKDLGLPTRKISNLAVKIANGDEVNCCKMVLPIEVNLTGKHIRLEDLIVFPFKRYRMILGMPFLKSFRPQINWNKLTMKLGQFEKTITPLQENCVIEQQRNLCTMSEVGEDDNLMFVSFLNNVDGIEIPNCLTKFAEVFDRNIKGGSNLSVKNVIETVSNEPVCRQAYRMSPL